MIYGSVADRSITAHAHPPTHSYVLLQRGSVPAPVPKPVFPGGAPVPERGHLHRAVGAVRVRDFAGRR